ncbi:MAG TPA: hypothetical protein VJJ52_03315 [Candidatus Nanoarchaeia archaeon]|nr:hypothetical protein [Candidatus Nanoarchaeia archaeon]
MEPYKAAYFRAWLKTTQKYLRLQHLTVSLKVIFDMFEVEKSWMEFFFLLIAAMGLIFALVVPSAMVGYALVFVSGYFAGRVLYQRRTNIVFPFYIIIAGFLIGYIVGMQYGNRIIAAALFIAGAVLSYQLHSKGILMDRLY